QCSWLNSSTAGEAVVAHAAADCGGALARGTSNSRLARFGTQWYIVFNVIGGAAAFPNDLREAATNFRVHGLQFTILNGATERGSGPTGVAREGAESALMARFHNPRAEPLRS